MASSLTFLKRGGANLLRNWLSTIPTIIVMAMVLTMFHAVLIVREQASTTLQTIQQKFSMTVYLKDDADPFAVGNLITALEQLPEVKKPVIYTSKEAAWQAMAKTFALDSSLLQKYKFTLPASLTITPRSPDETRLVQAYLETNGKNLVKSPVISQDKEKNVTTQMLEFIKSVEQATNGSILFFLIFFIVGGALLIGSALHLAISSRHRDIGIMKLVGASPQTIIVPFVIEGVLMSLIAFLLHLIFVAILPFNLLTTKSQLNALIFECMAVLILGAVVSYFATRILIYKKGVL